MANPNSLIINSPYSVPSQYWKFVEEGVPQELMEGRREAGYMVVDTKEQHPYLLNLAKTAELQLK